MKQPSKAVIDLLNWIPHCCDGRTFYTAHYWEVNKVGCYKVYLLRREDDPYPMV